MTGVPARGLGSQLLSKVFRTDYGMTPNDYRRRHQDDDRPEP